MSVLLTCTQEFPSPPRRLQTFVSENFPLAAEACWSRWGATCLWSASPAPTPCLHLQHRLWVSATPQGVRALGREVWAELSRPRAWPPRRGPWVCCSQVLHSSGGGGGTLAVSGLGTQTPVTASISETLSKPSRGPNPAGGDPHKQDPTAWACGIFGVLRKGREGPSGGSDRPPDSCGKPAAHVLRMVKDSPGTPLLGGSL